MVRPGLPLLSFAIHGPDRHDLHQSCRFCECLHQCSPRRPRGPNDDFVNFGSNHCLTGSDHWTLHDVHPGVRPQDGSTPSDSAHQPTPAGTGLHTRNKLGALHCLRGNLRDLSDFCESQQRVWNLCHLLLRCHHLPSQRGAPAGVGLALVGSGIGHLANDHDRPDCLFGQPREAVGQRLDSPGDCCGTAPTDEHAPLGPQLRGGHFRRGGEERGRAVNEGHGSKL
mmetsp:Transcript_7604/g.20347  ORF Transcript_7604/g.20347 Transcript_7604/m.20347 type:complete len:225 (-) Transcript_7604:1122-1796(-)